MHIHLAPIHSPAGQVECADGAAHDGARDLQDVLSGVWCRHWLWRVHSWSAGGRLLYQRLDFRLDAGQGRLDAPQEERR